MPEAGESYFLFDGQSYRPARRVRHLALQDTRVGWLLRFLNWMSGSLIGWWAERFVVDWGDQALDGQPMFYSSRQLFLDNEI